MELIWRILIVAILTYAVRICAVLVAIFIMFKQEQVGSIYDVTRLKESLKEMSRDEVYAKYIAHLPLFLRLLMWRP